MCGQQAADRGVVLLGDTIITPGFVSHSSLHVMENFFNNFSISFQSVLVLFRADAFSRIGYCPQFDALYQELTAREHLEMLATFHGYTSSSVPLVSATSYIRCSHVSIGFVRLSVTFWTYSTSHRTQIPNRML